MMCEKCKREMNLSSSHSMTEGTVTLRSINKVMYETYGVTHRLLRNRRRNSFAVESRAMFCKLASDYTNCSLPEIGRYIDRDHTTVMYLINVKKLSEMYEGIYWLVQETLEERGAVPIAAE